MRRGVLIAAVLGAAMFLPAAASAQGATCTDADLVGGWLYTFQKQDEPVVCTITVKADGSFSGGSCNVKLANSDVVPAEGALSPVTSCRIFGTVKMKGIGNFQFSLGMSTDRSVMIGALFNPKNARFYPVNMVRWATVE